jgi:hypothetical protein
MENMPHISIESAVRAAEDLVFEGACLRYARVAGFEAL